MASKPGSLPSATPLGTTGEGTAVVPGSTEAGMFGNIDTKTLETMAVAGIAIFAIMSAFSGKKGKA